MDSFLAGLSFFITFETMYLSLELSDARNGIRMEPYDASNYLLAGRIHLIRGDYEEGLKIFEQGISTITPGDPQHTDLKEWKNHSETCIQRRVDIISQCPYDVFSNIASRITQKGLQECIGVSRVWRDRMLGDPSLWQKVSITSFEYDSPLQILSLVCHHLRELSIELNESYDILKCLETLEAYNFSNIKSFHDLESGHSLLDPKSTQNNVSNRLYRALENIGKRLTYLEIGPETGPTSKISLERVLPVCENLSEFRCKTRYITSPSSGTWLASTTVLTRLKLISSEIGYSTLEPVLRNSPLLEEFIVDGCTDDITPIFEYSCPRLTLLAINISPKASFLINSRRNKGDGRLRHLFINRIPPSRSLLSLLSRNASMLETLQIGYSEGTREDWRPISTFTASNLKHLALDLFDYVIRYYAVDILKSHRHVQRLELGSMDDEGMEFEPTENSNTDALLRAVVGMRDLCELHLANIRIERKWADQLFEYYAAQGPDAPLTRLVVNDCRILETNGLLDISSSAANITSLTHLGLIGDTYEDLSESDIISLARHVGKMPKLSVFVLHAKSFSIDAARYIIRSTSLKHIYFETVTQWTARSLRHVVDRETTKLLQSRGIQVANFDDGIYMHLLH